MDGNNCEASCRDALDHEQIGARFNSDVNLALDNKGISRVSWGSGLWQQVLDLQKIRHKYTHISIDQDELWPDITVAENAIQVIREAVKDIYRVANKTIPSWIDDDASEGYK